jgi:transcriptional regulator with XRE-family HTH domain
MPYSKDHKKMLATIAGNIKRLREAKGWTQADLAAKMYKDKQAIQRIETGAINPRFLTLVEIAEALGVSASDILKGV